MLRKFKTYGSISRRERERRTRDRKAEVRAHRIKALFSREAVVAREHEQYDL